MLRFVRGEGCSAGAERAEAIRLSRALGVSERTAQLLIDRGLGDEAAAEAFLHPSVDMLCDPFAFADMQKAVERLERAVAGGERICIYGDYDADGVCAASILLLYLRGRGADVHCYIPSRHAEGYGMNLAAVEQLAAEGVKLLITVDNGVKANAELQRCRELGIDAIVTDHHIPGDEMPPCAALLCHTAPDCTYPNKNICGAGTAFKLVEAMAGRAAAMEYISLAGLATVADVVPLIGENRVFAALALEAVNRAECPVGILALVGVSFDSKRTVLARDFAFKLAPRLNAAGRMEHAMMAVELLTESDPARARELALRLHELNTLRQREEGRIFEEAAAQIEADDLTDKRGLVLKSSEWNAGIVGIAASKLAERYYRPIVLLCEEDGVLKGSARSVRGVDLHAALKENEDLFTRFGGHAYAAGVTLPAENFEAFAAGFDASIRALAGEELFLPAAEYEAELNLSELSMRFVEELSLLAPFGEGNPEPVFRSDGLNVKSIKIMGSDSKHLRFSFERGGQYAAGVWFYAANRFEELNDYGRSDLLYVPNINEFNGARSLQLQLRAMRPAAAGDVSRYLEPRRAKFFDAFSANVRYNKRRAETAYAWADPDEVITAETAASIVGTLVLCFTPSGAARFLRLAGEHGLYGRMEIGFSHNLKGPCAYHAAVLAPEIAALTIERFRTVIVYDTPLSLGMLDALKARAPHARILVARPTAGDAEVLFAEAAFDRERLAAFYRPLRARGGKFYNRAALIDFLLRETGEPKHRCALAADIMTELGFLSEEGHGIAFCPQAERRALEQSETYCTLASFMEMHKLIDTAARAPETGGSAGNQSDEEEPT